MNLEQVLKENKLQGLRAQIEKYEKYLETKTEEYWRIQRIVVRADKAKAITTKLKNEITTKLKNEISSEKEKFQKLKNEVSKLKNCSTKSARKSSDNKNIDSNSAHECPICACELFEDHSPVSLKMRLTKISEKNLSLTVSCNYG